MSEQPQSPQSQSSQSQSPQSQDPQPHDSQPQSSPPQGAEKPVEQWATGDEPMTGPQQSYLQTLAREAGEEVPDGLSKAEASKMIDRLQGASPRVDS